MTEPSRAPEPAILPCPFCGCDAITSERNRNWIAQCGMCNVAFADAREANPMSKPRPTCFARTSGYPTEAEAIAAWNRRSATPASPAELTKAGIEAAEQHLPPHVYSSLDPKYLKASRLALAERMVRAALSLSPSSPREPSEAAVLSKGARERIEQIAASRLGKAMTFAVILSPDEAYAILRAIDFPPSGGQ